MPDFNPSTSFKLSDKAYEIIAFLFKVPYVQAQLLHFGAILQEKLFKSPINDSDVDHHSKMEKMNQIYANIDQSRDQVTVLIDKFEALFLSFFENIYFSTTAPSSDPLPCIEEDKANKEKELETKLKKFNEKLKDSHFFGKRLLERLQSKETEIQEKCIQKVENEKNIEQEYRISLSIENNLFKKNDQTYLHQIFSNQNYIDSIDRFNTFLENKREKKFSAEDIEYLSSALESFEFIFDLFDVSDDSEVDSFYELFKIIGNCLEGLKDSTKEILNQFLLKKNKSSINALLYEYRKIILQQIADQFYESNKAKYVGTQTHIQAGSILVFDSLCFGNENPLNQPSIGEFKKLFIESNPFKLFTLTQFFKRYTASKIISYVVDDIVVQLQNVFALSTSERNTTVQSALVNFEYRGKCASFKENLKKLGLDCLTDSDLVHFETDESILARVKKEFPKEAEAIKSLHDVEQDQNFLARIHEKFSNLGIIFISEDEIPYYAILKPRAYLEIKLTQFFIKEEFFKGTLFNQIIEEDSSQEMEKKNKLKLILNYFEEDPNIFSAWIENESLLEERFDSCEYYYNTWDEFSKAIFFSDDFPIHLNHEEIAQWSCRKLIFQQAVQVIKKESKFLTSQFLEACLGDWIDKSKGKEKVCAILLKADYYYQLFLYSKDEASQKKYAMEIISTLKIFSSNLEKIIWLLCYFLYREEKYLWYNTHTEHRPYFLNSEGIQKLILILLKYQYNNPDQFFNFDAHTQEYRYFAKNRSGKNLLIKAKSFMNDESTFSGQFYNLIFHQKILKRYIKNNELWIMSRRRFLALIFLSLTVTALTISALPLLFFSLVPPFIGVCAFFIGTSLIIPINLITLGFILDAITFRGFKQDQKVKNKVFFNRIPNLAAQYTDRQTLSDEQHDQGENIEKCVNSEHDVLKKLKHKQPKQYKELKWSLFSGGHKQASRLVEQTFISSLN